MDTIFHEKQEGQLCAQHCLNALLQGPYYTAVDLATIAGQLDEEERRRMAGGTAGENSDEYRRFIAQPSANMDDTGFFSVQVIANAIGVWGLEIISYTSSDSRSISARNNPTSQTAFICNYREHWFTIRKLGNQWFNLNSLLTGPELISNTFLSLFLTQLETEGYSIHLVCGNLPECTADQMLRLIPAVQSVPPRLINEGSSGGSSERRTEAASSSMENVETGERGVPSRPLPGGMSFGSEAASNLNDDREFQAAMAMSLADQGMSGGRSEEEDFKLAMQLSKSLMENDTSVPQRSQIHDTDALIDQSNVVSEEDEMQKAIALSLEAENRPTVQPNVTKDKPSTSSASQLTHKKHEVVKNETLTQSISGAISNTKEQEKTIGNPGWPSKQENTIVGPSSSSSTTKDKSFSTKITETRPKDETIVQQQKMPPKTPASTPGPVAMPGAGQSLGSSVSTHDRNLRTQSSPSGQMQSTPDPEEVRRRRLTFLEKQNKKN